MREHLGAGLAVVHWRGAGNFDPLLAVIVVQLENDTQIVAHGDAGRAAFVREAQKP
jgi:hypothetical protein